MERDRDDEIDAAVLAAIEAANRRNQRYPTLAELVAELRARGVTGAEVAESADRLYRSGKVVANAGGGLGIQPAPDP